MNASISRTLPPSDTPFLPSSLPPSILLLLSNPSHSTPLHCIAEVIKWFAERADMIIVMFDAHKLDISDELKTVLDVLKPHQDKIRYSTSIPFEWVVITYLVISCTPINSVNWPLTLHLLLVSLLFTHTHTHTHTHTECCWTRLTRLTPRLCSEYTARSCGVWAK